MCDFRFSSYKSYIWATCDIQYSNEDEFDMLLRFTLNTIKTNLNPITIIRMWTHVRGILKMNFGLRIF